MYPYLTRFWTSVHGLSGANFPKGALPIRTKKQVSQSPRFQISCLGQFLIGLLVVLLIYWLLFWPMSVPPVGVEVTGLTAFRLGVRSFVDNITGGYLTTLNAWSDVGVDYMIIQMFSGLFEGISQGISNMFEGIGNAISGPEF